jgi:hypothetical protein
VSVSSAVAEGLAFAILSAEGRYARTRQRHHTESGGSILTGREEQLLGLHTVQPPPRPSLLGCTPAGR